MEQDLTLFKKKATQNILNYFKSLKQVNKNVNITTKS